jgi:tRNA threonylcarbamoyladenosine biosynthesis protein TsaB
LASLFIDSTYDISLGILDDELEWITFKRFSGQKASSIIQTETFNLFRASNLSIKDLDSVITIAGPGFYTGLRLSEGFADVMSFHGSKHCNFLSYDIPVYSGVMAGTWMTKAYRGEYFFHHWSEGSKYNKLISSNDLPSYLKDVDRSHFYIHSDSAIDDFSRELLGPYMTTTALLEANSKSVFSAVLDRSQKTESFYFRAPEDEFKVSL